MKPSLIVLDIQREYTTEDRSFYLKGHEKSLSNCSQILSYARHHGWDIAHIQHFNKNPESDRFQKGTAYAGFVKGFEPKDHEQVFIKQDYSCFSSPEFEKWILKKSKNEPIYLIGYSTAFCVNSTLEEAYRRGIKLCLIEDATLAKSVGNYSEKEIHDTLIAVWKDKGIIKIQSTQDLLVG